MHTGESTVIVHNYVNEDAYRKDLFWSERTVIAVLEVMFLSGVQSGDSDRTNFHPLGDVATDSHARPSINVMIVLAC